MPIYEYQCAKCCHHFEIIQGASDKDLKVVCPKCGTPNPQRVISTFSCGGSKGAEANLSTSCSPRPGRFT